MSLKKIQSCNNDNAVQNYNLSIEKAFKLYAFNYTLLTLCLNFFILFINLVQFTEILNQFSISFSKIQKIIVFVYFHVLLNFHVSLNSAVEAFKH